MSATIESVLGAIQKAGGKVRPTHLIKRLETGSTDKRQIQRAVQAALDRGVIRLDGDMHLIVVKERVAQAA
ncbi:MarR family transcriptional regulator [Rhizobium giardinii]|uniref:MarR family transcriptional regulator n=1 Tax=Rhizobium giardinii TaxID=56731 RepID=UPI0039E08791